MTSAYNTRSVSNAAAAAVGSASSITIEPRVDMGTIGHGQRRHFCIALTNNPRMLRGAEQALRDAAATAAATTTTMPSSVSARQRTASDILQGGGAAVVSSLPPLPPTQQQQTSVLARSRTRSTPRSEQQVPASTQPSVQESVSTTERHTYEREIEEDFKVQIQSILQNYLNKTKRSPPVNVFLDMTSMIQF